jgi:hypothetical protein
VWGVYGGGTTTCCLKCSGLSLVFLTVKSANNARNLSSALLSFLPKGHVVHKSIHLFEIDVAWTLIVSVKIITKFKKFLNLHFLCFLECPRRSWCEQSPATQRSVCFRWDGGWHHEQLESSCGWARSCHYWSQTMRGCSLPLRDSSMRPNVAMLLSLGVRLLSEMPQW